MSKPLDFQSIILTLQNFWAEQGCLVWQPYYSQIGAGTMNPGTFLRVLGPEPWNVGYVEPSIRPDDGRYGDNPNRLQQHYQFQVIMKPDPGNPQEIYLHSLEALGIDPRQHDIRFVEDNWEQPAIGAWGLGWEVWLDGQEITQFTYFQQAGGVVLNPVSVEITYGLERIAMALQSVRNFRDLRWNETFTYGDVNLQGEREHSKYYFEIADVERLRQMYSLYEHECESALAQGMILPAYDYILKCSHTFNVLDTRGAVGVTERQALFGRMRDLTRRVAEAYVDQRQNMEFPWLDKPLIGKLANSTEIAATAEPPQARQTLPADATASLLFEIGTEELPAGDLDAVLEQLTQSFPALLEENRLEHGAIKVMGTPRRLVVLVEKLISRQPDTTQIVKGPPAARAFDSLGEPTPAAAGFARGKGIDVKQLEVREIDGGKYVVAVVQETGRPTVDVLSEALPGLIASLRFDKSMRWNSSGVAFSRPIRWLLALYGQDVVPFEYAGLHSGRSTHGLRFHQPEIIKLETIDEYFNELSFQGVILDVTERQQRILEQVKKLATEAGGTIKDDPALLKEVTQLVETPTAFRGTFDKAHLDLPPEVLISVMKKHQRYFPVHKDGQLLPFFIGVRNGDDRSLDIVSDGNSQVIHARFADATFFINDDLKHPLEAFVPRLATLAFQFKLGSMLDKTKRIEKLTDDLIAYFKMSGKEAEASQRAAKLCKADLMTRMVTEMTSLQGFMGKYYALHAGESAEVAEAVFQHYLPRFAGDATPSGKPGFIVGMADRLDSLAGLFAAGLAPSGTKDPFAQRRMALGLVQNLIAWDVDFDLKQGLEMASKFLPVPMPAETQSACLEFITGRLKNYLLEQGYRYDIVDAILNAQGSNPSSAFKAVKDLTNWVKREDWKDILPAYARCVRITRDQPQRFEIDPAAMTDPSEKALYEALQKAEKMTRKAASIEDFFAAFLPLIPIINSFFDKVLVMSENPAERATRLSMLQHIAALADGAADFSVLEGF